MFIIKMYKTKELTIKKDINVFELIKQNFVKNNNWLAVYEGFSIKQLVVETIL